MEKFAASVKVTDTEKQETVNVVSCNCYPSFGSVSVTVLPGATLLVGRLCLFVVKCCTAQLTTCRFVWHTNGYDQLLLAPNILILCSELLQMWPIEIPWASWPPQFDLIFQVKVTVAILALLFFFPPQHLPNTSRIHFVIHTHIHTNRHKEHARAPTHYSDSYK